MDQNQDNNELSTLEDQGTVVNGADGQTANSGQTQPTPEPPQDKKKKKLSERIQSIITRVNIYFLIFILIVVVASLIVFVSYQQQSRETADPTFDGQPLSQEELEQIRDSDTVIGDPRQTLNIESNADFKGNVLIRDGLDVAGTIRVGGSLSLPGITVSGTSSFEQITANELSIAGNTSIQGQLLVESDLTVTGSGSFGGTLSAAALNIETLQLTNDLRLNRHIDAGGPTPGRTNGNALGNGGTSSVSGTDTAGTVTINTGGSPPAGCFVTINFAAPFNGTPHVVITPVGSAAAGLNYYITKTGNSFRICTTNPAPAGSSFSFDYIAID
jgi:cytoskeletal protein CcmA (bactofilin family)